MVVVDDITKNDPKSKVDVAWDGDDDLNPKVVVAWDGEDDLGDVLELVVELEMKMKSCGGDFFGEVK